jgi:thioredoxin-like negative regulator of GroEL
MDSIWTVANHNFADFINYPVSVLYFWAHWYSADRYMKNRILSLSHRFPKVKFGLRDVDDSNNWTIVSVLGLTQVPTVIIFMQGSRKVILDGPQSSLGMSRYIISSIDEAARVERLRQKSRHFQSRISI